MVEEKPWTVPDDNGISLDSKINYLVLLKVLRIRTGVRVKHLLRRYLKIIKKCKKKLVDEFFELLAYFNIISQELENFYLETALTSKCNISEPVLLINIGGGSTELVVLKDKSFRKKNIDLGVGTINTNYAKH